MAEPSALELRMIDQVLAVVMEYYEFPDGRWSHEELELMIRSLTPELRDLGIAVTYLPAGRYTIQPLRSGSTPG